jgi:hypothetical protein
MDFTELEQPLADGSRYALLVRDLASGMMLATAACRRATSRVTVGVLKWLARGHGAPLVVKSDNGSHFTARRVEKLLAKWRVWHLRSPPGTPQYNGAIEAGAGLMKQRLSEHWMETGGEHQLLPEDLEQERLRANETSGRGGPGPGSATPLERWRARKLITREDRMNFKSLVRRNRRDRRSGLRAEAGPDWTNDERKRAMVARWSIRRSLESSGLLEIRNPRRSAGEQWPDLSGNLADTTAYSEVIQTHTTQRPIHPRYRCRAAGHAQGKLRTRRTVNPQSTRTQ